MSASSSALIICSTTAGLSRSTTASTPRNGTRRGGRCSACCSHGDGSGAAVSPKKPGPPCDLHSDGTHRRGSPQTLPPGQKYAPFGVVTVSSQVIPRRIRPAIDSDGDPLDETEDLRPPGGVKSRSLRSVIRPLTVPPSRATRATAAGVGFSTLVLGDSAKRPRYATATTADSPNVQSVGRNSPLIQESDIVRLDEIFDQCIGARERSFRVELPNHTVRSWSDHALWVPTTLFAVSG